MPAVRTKTNNKKSPISVAFCFDHNMWMLAGVAIASLLRNAGARPYNIYCVVPTDLSDAYRGELSRMVADMHKISSITFLNANSDFDSSVTHQYTVGIYYRFMLVKLLPHVDKIIYMDADKAPAIIHYILKQPWLGRANKMGRVWWFYAAMTPFYAAFLADVNQTPDVVEKRILLFNCIPVMRVKMYMNLSKYYLFGFIPLFKVKSA